MFKMNSGKNEEHTTDFKVFKIIYVYIKENVYKYLNYQFMYPLHFNFINPFSHEQLYFISSLHSQILTITKRFF